jgi:hypothetical protein
MEEPDPISRASGDRRDLQLRSLRMFPETITLV